MLFLMTFQSTSQLFTGGMPITGLSAIDVLARIAAALIAGLAVGIEREMSKHPAGLRTNMLVSLGACIVMITAESIFNRYNNFSTMDPSRLGAQVISGVGFLGAGTIMQKGVSVQGLTTAASLWAVACLGLAAGNGDYFIVFVGTISMVLILSILENVQKRLFNHQDIRTTLRFHTSDLGASVRYINTLAQSYKFSVDDIEFENQSDGISARMKLKFIGNRARDNLNTVLADLLAERTIEQMEFKEAEET